MLFGDKFPNAQIGDQPVPGLYLTDNVGVCGQGCKRTPWLANVGPDCPGAFCCSEECYQRRYVDCPIGAADLQVSIAAADDRTKYSAFIGFKDSKVRQPVLKVEAVRVQEEAVVDVAAPVPVLPTDGALRPRLSTDLGETVLVA